MKKILITGKNSYIGTSLEKWLAKEPEEYQVDTVSTRDGIWEEKDFSPYDVVFHVAGIAHIKETKKNRNLYYKVNRDLAYDIAKKAKKEGVEYFIFLSSMSVYGMETGTITMDTVPSPTNAYGDSKLQAEELLNKLATDSFKVANIRPPMVYGKDCKGNFPRLVTLAKKTFVFPEFENERSMIYIDHLSEFLRKLIDNRDTGIYFPQNTSYVSTCDIVREIAFLENKKIWLIPLEKQHISFLNLRVVNKVFGNLKYEKSMSGQIEEYNIFSFEETIELYERG